MSAVVLRPYQETLVADIRSAFAKHRRVVAVAPTGSGKTATFAYIVTATAAKGNTVVIVAHRSEIVDQIGMALDRMGVRHGRIQPGHSMTSDPVQVAMIQTLARRLDKVTEPSLLVVDEAHHGVAGSWQTVMSAWPKCKVLGVTATPRRLDGKGLKSAFDAMVLGPTMADLIRDGFLAGYDYYAPPTKVDLSGIKTKMGDFAIDEVAALVDKQAITGDAVAHYTTHLQGRPAIAFCCTVDHSRHVADQFCAAGYRAASVDGSMTKAERRARVEGIGDGLLQVLTSCELISEGVDVPVVSGAILLRPTKSLGMFLQQVGRILRPKPDGSRAVILDHVSNVRIHGMPCTPHNWRLETDKPKGVAPMAVCEECYRAFAVAPGWKEEHEPCGPPPGPPDCLFAKPATGGGRVVPETVEGELETIKPASELPPPIWARGLSLVSSRGDDFKRLVRLADTKKKLNEIRLARGYKASWVYWTLNERMKRRQPAPPVEMPFLPQPAAQPLVAPPPAAARRMTLDELLDDVVAA